MPYKFLIADDSKAEHLYIEDFVAHELPQIECFHAFTGIEAIEKAKEILPDIILMDINMPELNGLDAIRELSKIPETSHIPIIVFTAARNFKDCFDAGANDFIQKPFDEITFATRIISALKLVDSQKKIQIKNEKIKNQHIDVLKQRDIIAKTNREILADLRYSRRIQEAVSPRRELLDELLDEYFIFNRPKSIVSGDFFWVAKKDDITLWAVGDSTGHGISGALMHMMGAIFLDEIMRNSKIQTASEILNQLRDHVMDALHQTGEQNETKDGMDIALCIIDKKNNRLQFAGANNPIYLIRNKELIHIRGDRMPVGIHINFNQPFTNHEIRISPGDSLYLFSDGYADQFGGPKGKKFRYKQFQNLVLSIQEYNLEKQGKLLEEKYDEWKGELEQLDDVLVMGIKIYY